MWPHRRQPTRLLRPWDFPGKSTGVGCQTTLTPLITSVVKIPRFFHSLLNWLTLSVWALSAPLALKSTYTSKFQRRQWQPILVLLPGKSHGWRSLVGCSPWGLKESDTTEQLHFHFSLSYIGEGNGNPLQCSCLENPRDRGAWWAAIYGVAQSQTRLKWLSSSSILQNLLF